MLNWIGVLGAFLTMAILVLALKHYTTVPTVNQTRIAERQKILAETRQKAQVEFGVPEWIGDRTNRLVRLPASVAMALAVQQWQDPAKGRAELLQRAEKAFYVPPPPPEAPSPFE
jgi:hypothetical protein